MVSIVEYNLQILASFESNVVCIKAAATTSHWWQHVDGRQVVISKTIIQPPLDQADSINK